MPSGYPVGHIGVGDKKRYCKPELSSTWYTVDDCGWAWPIISLGCSSIRPIKSLHIRFNYPIKLLGCSYIRPIKSLHIRFDGCKNLTAFYSIFSPYLVKICCRPVRHCLVTVKDFLHGETPSLVAVKPQLQHPPNKYSYYQEMRHQTK